MSLTVDFRKRLGSFTLDARFESERGVLGLLGASGSGKSMTLKCIAGIERPDRGRIVLDGETLFDSERRIDLPPQLRRVGYLFQNYALFPNMTVRQNILCGLRRETDRAAREAALNTMLDFLQLRGLEGRRPHQLSGGEQQRAALARILVNQPRLLMLDEPFSALDTHLRDQLQVQMKELLGAFGGDVLLVTHSQDEAYGLCGRITVVDGGRTHTPVETRTLFAAPGSRPAALLTGCQNVAPAARKAGDHTVEVPAWGLRLTTAQPVREGLDTVAIRPHAFSPACGENRFPIQVTGQVQAPFGARLRFRPAQAPEGGGDLWYDLPAGQPVPTALGVAPEDVLLLYP